MRNCSSVMLTSRPAASLGQLRVQTVQAMCQPRQAAPRIMRTGEAAGPNIRQCRAASHPRPQCVQSVCLIVSTSTWIRIEVVLPPAPGSRHLLAMGDTDERLASALPRRGFFQVVPEGGILLTKALRLAGRIRGSTAGPAMKMSEWRSVRNRQALARLSKALPENFPAAVLTHALARAFTPPMPRLAVDSYWRVHPIRADRLARALAAPAPA